MTHIMTRPNSAWAAASLLALALPVAAQQATQTVPQAPAPRTAPAPSAPATLVFPPVDPANFTATSPSVDQVNGFLKSMWGYDENRVWSIAAILATPAPGVSKVVVLVGDKGQGRQSQTVFFTTPDGKHVIADNVMPFGTKPFAETRAILQARADGASRGAKGNDLLLVEFADLQCSHCRDAQAMMDNLAQDFPTARIVVQDFPVAEIHPFAFRAATEGVCVRKMKGDAAFFTYAQAVYDTQENLTRERLDATLGTAAAKAGADPAAIAACAQTPEAKAAVNASVKLGHDIGVTSTPLLSINGRLIPLTSVSYEVLKRIIVFQANQDGIPLVLQPSLRTLK